MIENQMVPFAVSLCLSLSSFRQTRLVLVHLVSSILPVLLHRVSLHIWLVVRPRTPLSVSFVLAYLPHHLPIDPRHPPFFESLISSPFCPSSPSSLVRPVSLLQVRVLIYRTNSVV